MATPQDESFSSKAKTGLGSDPWSDLTWGRDAMNVTFETDIFDFDAEDNKSTFGKQPSDFESVSLFFPNDPMWDGADGEKEEKEREKPIVQVAIHEQLSAVYDDVSKEPSCQVDGSIVVKSSSQSPTTEPFCLIIRDLLDRIEGLELKNICTDISREAADRTDLHRSDKVLKILAPPVSQLDTEIPVATYTCTPKLRPVPMVSCSNEA